jgi:hypothetical protein
MSQSEARTAVELAIDAEDEIWLNARIAEYEDLLQYLHDH